MQTFLSFESDPTYQYTNKWQRVDLNHRPRAYEALDPLRLLNSLSVTEISELSKLSKAYISQVKNGKRPPSKRLLEILTAHKRSTATEIDYYDFFIMSRRSMEVSGGDEDQQSRN